MQADATGIALRANLLFALVFFFLVMPFVFMSLFTAGTTCGAGGRVHARVRWYGCCVSDQSAVCSCTRAVVITCGIVVVAAACLCPL
jgi:hypothetical protein